MAPAEPTPKSRIAVFLLQRVQNAESTVGLCVIPSALWSSILQCRGDDRGLGGGANTNQESKSATGLRKCTTAALSCAATPCVGGGKNLAHSL